MGWIPFAASLAGTAANYLFGRDQASRNAANQEKDFSHSSKDFYGSAEAEYQSRRSVAVAEMQARGYSPQQINTYWPVKMPQGNVTASRFGGGPVPTRAPGGPAAPSLGASLAGGALAALPILASHGDPTSGFKGGTDAGGTEYNTPSDVPGAHMGGVSSKSAPATDHIDSNVAPENATPIGKGVGSIGDYIYVPGRGLVLKSSLRPGDLAALGPQQRS